MIGQHGDIYDERAHLRDIYGLTPGDWVLVRRDGYIGATASSKDASVLEDYFTRVGITI